MLFFTLRDMLCAFILRNFGGCVSSWAEVTPVCRRDYLFLVAHLRIQAPTPLRSEEEESRAESSPTEAEVWSPEPGAVTEPCPARAHPAHPGEPRGGGDAAPGGAAPGAVWEPTARCPMD